MITYYGDPFLGPRTQREEGPKDYMALGVAILALPAQLQHSHPYFQRCQCYCLCSPNPYLPMMVVAA